MSEADVLARHLVGRAAPAGCAERYERACGTLLGGASPRDAAVAAFAVRHPWSLGPLDAALALLRPKSLLRQKLLLAAAILEATPEGAPDFLPRAVPVSRLGWLLARTGLVEAAWLAAGLPLLALLRARADLRR